MGFGKRDLDHPSRGSSFHTLHLPSGARHELMDAFAALQKRVDWLGKSKTLGPDASYFRKLGHLCIFSPTFDRVMGLVIVFNFVVIIIETDKTARDEAISPWIRPTYWILLTSFVMELVMRIFVLRIEFFHHALNVFDFVIISVDLVMSVFGAVNDELVGGVSSLRILRLARLARVSKVTHMFPELRVMIAGLGGAFRALFWGTVLLVFALMLWAVLAVQFIHPLTEKIDWDPACTRCPRAFSSTAQAALTFATQIVCGDSWGRETVPIIESYPITAVFFVGVYVSVGLAILNLILAVVVNVATEARDKVLEDMVENKRLAVIESHNQLYEICQSMDTNGDEELTMAEVERGFDNNAQFKDTLAKMDIVEKDELDIVWTILDADRSGTVSAKEFVTQIFKMKSSSTQYMLAYIKFYITEIKDKLRQDFQYVASRLDEGVQALEREEDRLEEEIEEIQEIEGNRSRTGVNSPHSASSATVNRKPLSNSLSSRVPPRSSQMSSRSQASSECGARCVREGLSQPGVLTPLILTTGQPNSKEVTTTGKSPPNFADLRILLDQCLASVVDLEDIYNAGSGRDQYHAAI